MKATVVYLHAITPVHSGTGQTVAVIDLPIAREKATGWPIIPGSSLKGVVRSAATAAEDHEKLFGTQRQAGDLVLTDQRILCLPVRSFFGTFAWVTCPLVLDRFVKDMTGVGAGVPFTCPIPSVTGEDACMVTQTTQLTHEQQAPQGQQAPQKVYLEDLDLNATRNPDTTTIAAALVDKLFANDEQAKKHFKERFAIVSDELFNFLSETGTEVAARIALNERGTTTGDGGNLWYEEAVPAESIFAGAALCADEKEPSEVLQALNVTCIQIGGNASVGRGLCRLVVQ